MKELVNIGECKDKGLINIEENERACKYRGKKEREIKSIGEINSLAYSEECYGNGRRVHMGNNWFTSGCFISRLIVHLFVSSGYGLLIDF